MDLLGRDMVREAEEIVRARYNTTRPASRRRSPGTTRLDNAFTYEVSPGDDFPINIDLVVRGGDAVQAKVASLNWGSTPHRIVARGPDSFLVFPADPLDPFGRKIRARAVRHPGTKGTHFLESARSRALTRFRRQFGLG
jgi:hypothetical protein